MLRGITAPSTPKRSLSEVVAPELCADSAPRTARRLFRAENQRRDFRLRAAITATPAALSSKVPGSGIGLGGSN
jgi:hypothetical protein